MGKKLLTLLFACLLALAAVNSGVRARHAAAKKRPPKRADGKVLS